MYLCYYPSYDEKKAARNWKRKPKRQARLNIYRAFLEALAGNLNPFRAQVAVSLLKLPHGGFRSKNAVT
jgi:hypothetical protein